TWSLSRARPSIHHRHFCPELCCHCDQHLCNLPRKQRYWPGNFADRPPGILALEPPLAAYSTATKTMRLRHSDYDFWAKTRSKARYNLATSGVASFPLRELPVTINQLEINGDSTYGYAPLQQA